MRKLIAMLAACCVSTAAQAQSTQINPQWSLGRYEKSCIVDTQYTSKLMFFVRAHTDWKGWDIRLCHENWRITQGKEYEGVIKFNDNSYNVPFVGTEAEAPSGGKCIETQSWFGFDSEVFKRLMIKPWWQVTINGKKVSKRDMRLTGSKQALAVLAQCHKSIAGGTFDRSPDSGDTF